MNIFRGDQIDSAPKTGGVYVIYLTHNPSKGYIGSSNNFHRRFKQHYTKLSKSKHGNYKLQRLWKHYKNNFRFAILENLDDIAYARVREQVLIDFYPEGSLYNLDNEVRKHRSD